MCAALWATRIDSFCSSEQTVEALCYKVDGVEACVRVEGTDKDRLNGSLHVDQHSQGHRQTTHMPWSPV